MTIRFVVNLLFHQTLDDLTSIKAVSAPPCSLPTESDTTLNEPETCFPGELVDIPPSKKQFSMRKRQGRPRTSLLDQVTQQCHPHDDPKQLRYRCIGEGCRYSLAAPANRKRILKHAAQCHRLDDNLRHAANVLLADESPGARLDALQSTSAEPLGDAKMEEPKKLKNTMIEVECRKAGRACLTAQLDLAIIKLISAAALPPTLVDYREWKDIFSIANSIYRPACSTTIADQHIPSEAARVRELSLQYLRKQHHLTISFDGGTTKWPKSIYTVHFTTSDGRSFLIEGEESSDTSHTGEYLARMLLKTMDLVGRYCFSGITSDNTGNTRLARQLVSQEVKTCIPMSDVCHHLNLLAKDLAQLEIFRDVSGTTDFMFAPLTYISDDY